MLSLPESHHLLLPKYIVILPLPKYIFVYHSCVFSEAKGSISYYYNAYIHSTNIARINYLPIELFIEKKLIIKKSILQHLAK